MLIMLLAVILFSAIAGIFFWNKRRILSFIFFSPLIIVFVLTGFVIYHSGYQTTPDSLHLTVHKKNNIYTVKGKWKDRLELYNHPSDFIVFYIPNNEKIMNMTRERNIDFEYLKVFHNEIRDLIRNEKQIKDELQIFDIKSENEFQFSFHLPDGVNPNEVKLYYIHAIEEPMDPLKYWIKNIKLD